MVDLTPAERRILSGATWAEYPGDGGALVRVAAVIAYPDEVRGLVRKGVVKHRHATCFQLTALGMVEARLRGAKL